MEQTALVAWLLENGGPAIRYRAAMELLVSPVDVDLERLESDLLVSPMTQLWLERVGQPGGLFAFHSSKPDAFENAASKLCDLGLSAGTPVFDERMSPYRRWLDEQAQAIDAIADVDYAEIGTPEATQSAVDRGIRWFEAMLVAARLAWMGYADAPYGMVKTSGGR